MCAQLLQQQLLQQQGNRLHVCTKRCPSPHHGIVADGRLGLLGVLNLSRLGDLQQARAVLGRPLDSWGGLQAALCC